MADSPRPGSDRQLRHYWVRGEGAAKIVWGTEGSFRRCVTHLGKYVANPEGLCAEYHHEATGEWPGKKNHHHDGAMTATGEQATMAQFDVDVVDAPLVAAAVTVTIPDAPPPEWFDEPVGIAAAQGAFHIEQNGRVYGLLGPAHVAHRAFRDRRVEVPRGNVDYSRWMKRDGAMVADGGRVTAGPVTFDCGHADPTSSDYAARRQHYDNSCSVFASVRIGESDNGVWVAGALMPGVTGEQIARAGMCQLSGDWQPHPEQPGKKEFIGALLVPVPGFPSSSGDNGGSRPRASVTVDREGSLVAAYVPVIVAPRVVELSSPEVDMRPVVDMLARKIGRDPESLVAAARSRVGR